MKLVNNLLNFIIYVALAPLVLVSLYVIYDSCKVSKSAVIDASLVSLVNQDGDEVFDALEEESEYTIAWLRIEGTNINYPVVKGKDNAWFLNRNYRGEFATAGSLFLDYRNEGDFSDAFSIIYGHRMGNGEMFSDIQKFKNDDFFSAHKGGVLKRRGGSYGLEISAYAEVNSKD